MFVFTDNRLSMALRQTALYPEAEGERLISADIPGVRDAWNKDRWTVVPKEGGVAATCNVIQHPERNDISSIYIWTVTDEF